MSRIRLDRTTLAVTAVGSAALTAGAALAQRRHLGQIKRDPLNDRLSAPPRGRALKAISADGTEIHVEVFEPAVPRAELPTFVLAHGWTEQLIYWTLVIERLLDAGHRVAAYDLRGHGHSGRPPGNDFAIARFGEDLEAVLAAVCPEREPAIVAGHSLGGMSIAAWAHDFDVTQRVVGAALCFTGVSGLLLESTLIPVPALAALLNRTPLAAGVLATPGSVPSFSTPVSQAMVRYVAFGPGASPALVAFYERMLVDCPSDVRAGVALSLASIALDDAMPRLTVPTVVIAGAQDRLTPPVHAERMAASLPALHSLIVMPQTGHMGPLERPDEVAAALLALVAGAGTTAAATPAAHAA